MTPLDVAVAVLIAISSFFALVAAIGIVRLPDVYARVHAVSKSETLGAILALAAVALVLDTGVSTIKAVVLLVFLFLTNPTAAHAVTRAAEDQGIEPWTTGDREDTMPTEGTAGGPPEGGDRQ
jgi:multicomponent Na+:H+ antiporter subunit G